MRLPDKNRLRDMQLAFIGKLMAGLSHEFKNHLAIIKELNGLIEDLLLLEESLQPENRERINKNITGIDERIKQAAENCRYLSGFSHRMDQPLSSFGVTDVLLEEIYLIERFARQKQVKLNFLQEGDSQVIFNNPALLQFSVFCIVWPALESLEKDGQISITSSRQGKGAKVVVNITGTTKTPENDFPWQDMLPETLQILGAEIFYPLQLEDNVKIAVTIPSLEDRSENK